MKAADFHGNFPPGSAVPPLLTKLLAYQNRVNAWYSGHFRLTDGGQKDAVASFDGDKVAASQFILFGRELDGSSYGFWLYEGRTLGNAPIVFLGSEGTDWKVLANSLEEFLALLAVGEDEIGFAAPIISEPEEPF